MYFHPETLGLATFVDPPNGSVIANFEGTENPATISCNITTDQGVQMQVTTQWHVEYYRGNTTLLSISSLPPGLFEITGDPVDIPDVTSTFENRVRVLNLVSDLDGAIIFCGIGAVPRQAHFVLRIYS